MKVRNGIFRLTCRVLYESLGKDMVVRIARTMIPGYNIHERSGIPENIPITVQTAAEQTVRDIVETGRYLQLIEFLIVMDSGGYMGREYPLLHLGELVKAIHAEGYRYDRATGLFMEDAKDKVSVNWGRLADGEERQFALLRLDIVHNSILVKENDKERIDAAYAELRSVVSRAVNSRMGRVWLWEGDGCLCGFLFGKKERSAILAGMEILHELYFFNRLFNPLSAPLQVRIAAHGGPLRYTADPDALKKAESIREVTDIESRYTAADNLCVSANLFLSMDRVIQDRFRPEKALGGMKLRHYAIELEQA